MSFIFELALGDDTVKRVVFPTNRGRRSIRTSSGDIVGTLILTPRGLTLELDNDAASVIAEADFSVH